MTAKVREINIHILIGTKEQGIYLYDCCTQQLTRFTSDI